MLSDQIQVIQIEPFNKIFATIFFCTDKAQPNNQPNPSPTNISTRFLFPAFIQIISLIPRTQEAPHPRPHVKRAEKIIAMMLNTILSAPTAIRPAEAPSTVLWLIVPVLDASVLIAAAAAMSQII
mmetsp:Transcript_574/g.950  ORF Transcript_574/g.950 Transcript_574/m.950 type:complete len:125 (-) Transcript_574:422-796(-)